jgi:hypothetical protein
MLGFDQLGFPGGMDCLLTLCQLQGADASVAELLQRVKQLLACTAETAESLGQRRQHDTTWLLLQPLLRLLLWLIPEHVPQHPQLHQGPGSPRVSAAAQAPAAHQGSVKDQGPQTLSGSGDWRYSLGLAYAREIVRVSPLEVKAMMCVASKC